MSHDGIPGLDAKLNHLFVTVAAPTRSGRYSNDAAARALAERGVDVSGVHLSHLRSGRRDNPSARLLATLAELFGVPIAYFFDSTVEARVNENLEELSAIRDSRVKALMRKAEGVSADSLNCVVALLEHLRKLERLDPATGDKRTRDSGSSADEPTS